MTDDLNIHVETIHVEPKNVPVGSWVYYTTDFEVPSMSRVTKIEQVGGAWRVSTTDGMFVIQDGDTIPIVA